MKRIFRILILWAVFLVLISYARPVYAVKEYYEEEFTDSSFCDSTGTTCFWDVANGELKLPPFEMEVIDTITFMQGSWNIDLQGTYAYVAANTAGLKVVDITDPSNLTLAGSYDTPGYARDVAVSGNYAYVADAGEGIQVIDVSDPANPVPVTTLSVGGTLSRLTAEGNYLYLAVMESGFYVIDITNPTYPSIAFNYDTPGMAKDVAVAGDYAFVSDESSLLVFDISDPAFPSLAGSYSNTGGFIEKTIIEGDYAYACDQSADLLVLDISDPTTPVLIGSHNLPLGSSSIAVDGDFVYMTRPETHDLLVFDVSDPTAPSILYSLNLGTSWIYSIELSADLAYVGVGWDLRAVDISDLTHAVDIGQYDTPGSSHNVRVEGDYAFVADYNSGLQVIDITDPFNLLYVGSCDTPGHARGLDIAGDYVYIADSEDGLQVLDISDPSSPFITGSSDSAFWSGNIRVRGDYAYMSALYDGLRIVDISDPSSPAVVAEYDTPETATDVDVSGDFAFIADGSSLQIINISDPTNPSMSGYYATPGHYYSVAVSGNFAYMLDTFAGSYAVDIIDVSDTYNPLYAGTVDGLSYCSCLTLKGRYAFVGASYNLYVVDISDPTDPFTVSSDSLSFSSTFGLDVEGDYAFLASTDDGIRISQVFERKLKCGENRGCSSVISSKDADIINVRIATEQTGSILWEVSADSGGTWQEIPPDSTWHSILSPGNDLFWRSTHLFTGGTLNPTCSHLYLEWEEAPTATLVQYYSAAFNGSAVEISWLLSEIDEGAKFSAYRMEYPTGAFIKLEASGLERTGLRFSFEDRDWNPGSIYIYRVTYSNGAGESLLFETGQVMTPEIPLTLHQNEPNPFNPTTRIRYYLPAAEHVTLTVYDVSGKRVARLYDGIKQKGNHSITWSGMNSEGSPVSSGVYIYSLEAGKRSLYRKMILMR